MRAPNKIAAALMVLGLGFMLISCGGGSKLEDQAKNLLSLWQNKKYDDCVGLAYKYHYNMSKFKDEPQFKQKEMAHKVGSDIRDELFNEDRYTSVAYLFRFPGQVKILEAVKATSESADGQTFPVYRVFAEMTYNSMEQSPEAAPLLVKPEAINYNNYKVRDITFHFDLDPDTGLYMGWGSDKHKPW